MRRPEPCQACESHAINPLSGSFRMQCLQCCTRLVLRTFPLKHHAAAMLQLVQKHHGTNGRAAVSASVRQALEKRH